MTHALQCRCGTLKGEVRHPRRANRVICYCRDCQAFARFLGRADEILDDLGGTDVIQVLPRHVTLTQGTESLACIRLTSKGLVRWYAACCRTPIGNTLHTRSLSFIGLVHTCLETTGASLDSSFGPVRTVVNTQSATGEPKPVGRGLATTLVWFIGTTAKARVTGHYKQTPFFDPVLGTPVVAPRILTADELAQVRPRPFGSSA